jgi:hypothetical protein
MKTFAGREGIIHQSSMAIAALIVAALLSSAAHLSAKPRLPVLPWPGGGIGALFHENFDQPCRMPTNQVVDTSIWAESWTGWCLDRTGPAPLAPWAVPMVATNGRPIIDSARGAVRFWYQPAWNGTSTGLGTGPGTPATLLALVVTNGATSATWWELTITSDGNNVQLLCPQSGTPSVCLSAPVAFQAGAWTLLTLCYSETNSAMFVNDQLAVSGSGLPALPAVLEPIASLTIGSALDGQSPAAGQIEEFATFTGRNRFRQMTGQEFGLSPAWDIERYYGYLAPIAELGPISDAELAAREQARAQRMAALQASRIASPMQNGPGDGPQPDSFLCGTNYMHDVWLTNIVVWSNAESGWTTSLSIGGGTNGALYDLFCTTNLSGASITNLPWVWVTNGYACDTIVLTNQPAAAAFYILGTPQDTDNDQLTDAFELLVSHSDPTLSSTRGDGIDDRTAYLCCAKLILRAKAFGIG